MLHNGRILNAIDINVQLHKSKIIHDEDIISTLISVAVRICSFVVLGA
jgi:hypothetical protein